MDEIKFNAGDKVRVNYLCGLDEEVGIKVGDIGTVTEAHPRLLVKFDGIYADTRMDKDGARYMSSGQLELVPFEIPASPFYVAAFGGFSYKVEVDGLFYSLTCLENDSHWPRHAETRKIPGHFSENRWKLIDPPAPAVDPVVAAAAEVQRLLREYEAAVIAGDEADAVAEKAAENRRNIGQQLGEAKRQLEKANHEAAGIEYSEKLGPKYGGSYGR